MEMIYPLFEVITPWHWLVLALVLLGLEMMFATYDLLWLSGAAFLTAAWAALPLPVPLSSWQAEGLFFCVSGIGLLILGRTVFKGFREVTTDRPHLNQRGRSMVGKTAVAPTDFAGGEGRVKFGDSTWLASAVNGVAIAAGTTVTIQAVEGTVLKVSI